MLPAPRLTRPIRLPLLPLALAAALAAWPGLLAAQSSGDSPTLRFGLSTGLVAHDNRGLDGESQGSTFEYISRLDFDATFATPIQQLEVSGRISLRAVNGAEENSLDRGLVEPRLSIGYARQARDAQLSASLRYSEIDVSSSTLEEIIGVPDPQLVTAEGTRRSTVFDSDLELRRRAPFGITLSAGYTGLRYSDVVGTSLTDQDRFRLRTRLRLDINPSLQGTLTFGYTTFEDLGSTEGVRETFNINGRLSQGLGNGTVSLQFGATSTEDGERYTLSAGRSITTATWDISGTLGVTRDIAGDLQPSASLNLEHALRDGTLSASLSQRIASGVEDDEEQIRSLNLSYVRQLNTLTRFNTNLSYSETEETAGGGNASSLGTLAVGFERSLTRDIALNVGLQHRISEDSNGVRARDNRLSIFLRRDLSARR